MVVPVVKCSKAKSARWKTCKDSYFSSLCLKYNNHLEFAGFSRNSYDDLIRVVAFSLRWSFLFSVLDDHLSTLDWLCWYSALVLYIPNLIKNRFSAGTFGRWSDNPNFLRQHTEKYVLFQKLQFRLAKPVKSPKESIIFPEDSLVLSLI